MITSLHKKIALALMLFAQIIKPMEQSSLQVSKFCEQSFIAESVLAVGGIVGNLMTSHITKPRDSVIWKKKLHFKDQVFVTGSIYSGLLAGVFFSAKSMDDNLKSFLAICGHDSQEWAYARTIVWLSVFASLVQETAFIQRKAINQLRKDGNLHGKVTWGALAKQVGLSDLLVYAFGFYLLMIFPTVGS